MSSYVGSMQQVWGESVPWYLRGKRTGALVETIGATFDAALEGLAQGLQLSQPLSCDASALPVLAADRGIRLYATEPEASQRYRLSQWRQIRRAFGSAQGVLRNVQPLFLPNVPEIHLVHERGGHSYAAWHTLTADGVYSWALKTPSNWDWDGAVNRWSRYWLVIRATWVSVYGYDEGHTYDGTALWDSIASATIADVIAAATDAEAAHSALWGIVVCFDDTSLDPTADVTTDPTGWTSHPAGNWYSPIDITGGAATRDPSVAVVYNRGQL